MKRYLKYFNLTPDFVRSCVYECLGKKRWTRKDTSYLLAEYWIEIYDSDDSIHRVARMLRNQAYADRTKLYALVDYMSFRFYEEIKQRRMELPPIQYQIRVDGSSGKKREIGISSMKQQCFDYIAVNACLDMFNAKIGTYQCASIPNRGQMYGKKAIEKWVRKHPTACKHIVKCDVKSFYGSVNHSVLKRFLAKDIANNDVLYLINALLDSYKQGLCIGSYLSQYLANYFLSYAYHHMDEQCYKIRRHKRINLLSHKLLYMDDIFLCGPREKDVIRAFHILLDYLKQVLLLKIKDNFQIFELDNIPIDIMGFKIYSTHTSIRKRIFDRLNKIYQQCKNLHKRMNLRNAGRVISYYGYLKHTNSFRIKKKLKTMKVLYRAKEIISYAARNNYYKSIRTGDVYAVA